MLERLIRRDPRRAGRDDALVEFWRAHTAAEWQTLVAIPMVLAAIQGCGPWLADLLRYERAAVARGQWWRLVTANLLHYDLRHLLMNSAAFMVMWALFVRSASLRQWSVVALASACAVTGGLYAFMPEVSWYLGLSGMLHGLWMAGALLLWRREGARGLVCLGLLLGKLGLEQFHGPLTSALTPGMPVVPAAHLFGAAAGLLVHVMRSSPGFDPSHRHVGP